MCMIEVEIDVYIYAYMYMRHVYAYNSLHGQIDMFAIGVVDGALFHPGIAENNLMLMLAAAGDALRVRVRVMSYN